MNTRYILLIVLSFLLIACEDRLEISPTNNIEDDVALSDERNIANLLIGNYEKSGRFNGHGGGIQVISDLLGANSFTDFRGTFFDLQEIFNHQIFVSNGAVEGVWNNGYNVINQSNLILDNLDKITSSAEEGDRVEGEALFLRALNYFDIVRLFASGELGVPLRDTGISDFSGDLSIARSTTSEIYNFIIADLSRAIELLPAQNSFFADKYSAEALLARVYLSLGELASARDAAHNVIMNSGRALAPTFDAAFNNDVNSVEDLFAFQVTSQSGSNALISFHASEGNGGRGGDIQINGNYLSLFDSEQDQRSTFFYTSPQNGGTLTSKYENQFANVTILRLAEMYLIRAEANQALGTEVGQSPLADINLIRERASASPLTAVSIDDILEERIRELAFEGFFIDDIKRNSGTANGLSHDDPRLVLPIPLAEINSNSLIEQNPGY